MDARDSNSRDCSLMRQEGGGNESRSAVTIVMAKK